MAPSSEVAPPSEPSGRWQRTGYLALAASGLVLATAFGAVAQVTSSDGQDTADGDDSSQVTNTGNNGQTPELDNPAPAATTEMVDGKPVPGERPGRPSPTVTTSISIGPDGTPTRVTTTQENPQRPPQSSSRDDLPSRPDPDPTTTRPDPTSEPDPTTSNPPPSSDTSEPSDPPPSEPSPSEPEPDPTSGSGEPPSSDTSSSGSATAEN
ncbi:hypothetical protein [Prauserella rugosa]|uniref:Serine/threonine-protein kinase n=1 Tax=Prauserella rugosa TaxID=43354 RepID=A0A660CNL1_9PSEU|nr:hypothetical protein [Prauserella rugosa]TWH22861.1 serine/threonine-protein kinase [Prauserella rugosa]